MLLSKCKWTVGNKVWFVDQGGLRSGIIDGVDSSYHDEDLETTNFITLSIRVMKRDWDEDKNTQYNSNTKPFKIIKIDHDEVFGDKSELMKFVTARSDKE